MNKTSNQLVFFGTEDFSAQILHQLILADFQIEAVITKPDVKAGRGRKLKSPAVKILANEHQIPVFQVQNKQEIATAIDQTSKFASVLASFGKIISLTAIDAFEFGIINVHPSLLPLYRGPSPIESAILNGDKQTGVSIMALAKAMDAGPIYAQRKINLNQTETASDLYHKLAQVGGELLIETLPKIFQHLKPTPQDGKQATYCQLLKKDQAWLDPTKTAVELERQIRAFELFPRSRYQFKNQTCIVLDTEVSDQPDLLSIQTADQYLNVKRLIAPSGKTMSDQAFNNGY